MKTILDIAIFSFETGGNVTKIKRKRTSDPGYIEDPFHFPGIPPFTIANDEGVDNDPRSNHFSIVTSPFLVNNKIPLKSESIRSLPVDEGEILKPVTAMHLS